MAIRADRVGVRQDQVDIHGRVTSPSFLNEILEDLPEWTDMPVWVNGTEELLPSNNSVPVTSPILADIAYPDIRRDNQYFTYRESPTSVDGLAKIKSIKGNTLVWNQLAKVTESFTSSISNGVTLSRVDDHLHIEGTATATATFNSTVNCNENINFKPGHKFLLSINPNNVNVLFGIQGYGLSYFAPTVSVVRPSSQTTDWQGVFQFRVDSGVTVNADLYLQALDLTQMGLDITDPSDFTSLFPLSYYSYNQGSLLSFNGNGIKTVGKNLVDIADVTLSSEGNIGFRAVSLEKGTYTFSVTSSNSVAFQLSLYRSNNTSDLIRSWTTPSAFQGRAYLTFTLTENANYLRAYFNNATELTDFQIEIGTVASEYEPYTSSTSSLPISTYFPNGMKSAGNVYDELTPRKAITRIGAIDLGSLSWGYSATAQRFYSLNFANDVKNNNANTLANAICARYKNGIWNEIQGDTSRDMMFSISESNILVRDKRFTTASEFKQAVTGTYVLYELATPVELPTMSFE